VVRLGLDHKTATPGALVDHDRTRLARKSATVRQGAFGSSLSLAADTEELLIRFKSMVSGDALAVLANPNWDGPLEDDDGRSRTAGTQYRR
jgi:hypothetical protein